MAGPYVFVVSSTAPGRIFSFSAAGCGAAELTAPDGAAGDYFGYSVAVSGDTAVMGAWAHDTPAGENAGSAYVFVRSGTTWTERAHLFASDGSAFDNFGTAVVGAWLDDTPGGSNAESACVFWR